MAFVLNDDESTCGPPLVQFPGGDERAADVQPSVDENRGQVSDCRDLVKDATLAEKRVVGPGMGYLQGEQFAELRVLLGEPRREGGVQGDVGVLPGAPGQRGRGAYVRIGVCQPFDIGVEQAWPGRRPDAALKASHSRGNTRPMDSLIHWISAWLPLVTNTRTKPVTLFGCAWP